MKKSRSTLGVRIGRLLAVCLCCLPVLFSLGCATGPAAIQPDDPLFGTWINEEYDQPGHSYFPKSVMFPDGSELSYERIADSKPTAESQNTIEKTWIDAQGNHWYKIHHVRRFYATPELIWERFTLSRVNAGGTILESSDGRYEYPKELSPLDIEYSIRYKQK